jgi:probable rRNA maturation factor
MPASRPPIVASPPIEIDILVEAGDWPSQSELRAIAFRVLGTAIEIVRPTLAKETELSLVFTDDAHIRVLNRQFLNSDSATNVLSFPAAPAATAQFGMLLGDVILARETILREAEAEGLVFEDHLAHLIVHGFLHILGYDHADEAEAAAMEGLETKILGELGIADPYSERSQAAQ